MGLETSASNEDFSKWEILTFITSAIVFLCFIFGSVRFGTRALGLAVQGNAAAMFLSRRISYGWTGRPPSGHITGAPAVVLSLLMFSIGSVMLFWPEIIVSIFGWDGIKK
jgi:hypothetical protein